MAGVSKNVDLVVVGEGAGQKLDRAEELGQCVRARVCAWASWCVDVCVLVFEQMCLCACVSRCGGVYLWCMCECLSCGQMCSVCYIACACSGVCAHVDLHERCVSMCRCAC